MTENIVVPKGFLLYNSHIDCTLVDFGEEITDGASTVKVF